MNNIKFWKEFKMIKAFAGIEGGASFSKAVLIRSDGKVLASVEDAPSTNHLLVGIDVCHQRINDIVSELMRQANIPDEVPVALGLCLSGCEDEESNQIFSQQLQLKYPTLTENCSVSSDTIGSILTVTPTGGIVLIAGTGSNGLLLNPDGNTIRCGGWGHILGDHGSAFWIANKAIRTVIGIEDNFSKYSFKVDTVKKIIFNHFNVNDFNGLLKPVYTNFDKSRYAFLCKLLATAAKDGDELSLHVFKKAGYHLGRHVKALLPKVDETLLNQPGGLSIVCTGSVFKSWSLLKEGFLTALSGQLNEFRLLVPNKSSAIGAAFLSARNVGFHIPVKFEENSSTLFHFKKSDSP